jgi:hypothetical protein
MDGVERAVAAMSEQVERVGRGHAHNMESAARFSESRDGDRRARLRGLAAAAQFRRCAARLTVEQPRFWIGLVAESRLVAWRQDGMAIENFIGIDEGGKQWERMHEPDLH